MTRRQLWPAISIVLGAVFAIEAVTNASGLAFTVTAIAGGAVYALVGSLTRTNVIDRGRDRGRSRRRLP